MTCHVPRSPRIFVASQLQRLQAGNDARRTGDHHAAADVHDEVRYTAAAREDLLRLFDSLLTKAETVEDFDAAQRAIETIRVAVESHLGRTPLIFRKAAKSPFVRELVIPFGGAGYVALYEIERGDAVNVLAVRHQFESDYH